MDSKQKQMKCNAITQTTSIQMQQFTVTKTSHALVKNSYEGKEDKSPKYQMDSK